MRLGEFIAHVNDVYFPHDRDYHGGTDSNYVPVIPGNDFPPDASHGTNLHCNTPAPGDMGMTKIFSFTRAEKLPWVLVSNRC